ncbi:MAG: hypothetical protein GY749_18605 [Desulfobacteraceae bacterium]|nr:hypothetical protein [Desulfobacteraceae bacterium]
MKNSNTIKSRLLSSTKDQARDTGLALILICLLIAYIANMSQFVPVAIILLLLTMVWPDIFRPAAWFWFGLSHFMGTIATRILLTIIFFLMVTPVGFIRRLTGADAMQIKKWKKNSDSLFIVRDYKLSAEDIDKPF